jgi:hypothetical protein
MVLQLGSGVDRRLRVATANGLGAHETAGGVQVGQSVAGLLPETLAAFTLGRSPARRHAAVHRRHCLRADGEILRRAAVDEGPATRDAVFDGLTAIIGIPPPSSIDLLMPSRRIAENLP